jgi:hypothetical protein
MGDWKLKRKTMDSALKSGAVMLLRELGFKGTYPHFRRILAERVDTIGFQFSQWGPQLYVELGVADPDGRTLLDGTRLPPETLKYYECPARKRIGENPFDFEVETTELVADRVRASIDAAHSEWETMWLRYKARSQR